MNRYGLKGNLLYNFKFDDKNSIYFIIAVYFLLNLCFLESFPFVHSDEAWLASLTRAMTEEGSVSAVEDFFILTERHPHAIKTLFHLLQMPFISISFSIFSVRILSLLFSCITLLYFYKTIRLFSRQRFTAYAAMLFLMTDIQYLYISRFARQEIILLASLVFTFFLLSKDLTVRKSLIAASVTGISIGIHPNSFIVFITAVFVMIVSAAVEKKKWREIIFPVSVYIMTVSVFALFFVSMSVLMDREFFCHYLEFGSRHGVSDNLLMKLLRVKRFYYKMFRQISGTYYLPDIRFQLLLFSFAVLLSPVLFFRKHKSVFLPLSALAGINISIIMIGKYSPPSIVFIIPFGWILTALIIDSLNLDKKYLLSLFFVIFIINFSVSAKAINEWEDVKYSDYGKRITENIEKGEKVFANLNTAFFLEYGQLASYNDIDVLGKSENGFAEYIKENNISCIIYSEELDIIYRERPVWNDLYGNLYPLYDEIKEYISDETEIVYEFTNRVYPVRIVDYMKDRNYSVIIYRVKNRNQ